MKILPLLLASVAVSSTAWADAKFSKFTADYYKGAYDLYEGQEISLKVAFVKPYSYKSDIPDVRFFHAVTRDDSKEMAGGDIPVAVPINGGDDLIRRYGTAPADEGKTRLLRGVLRADGHGLWFVDVNGNISKTLDARRQTEIAPAATPAPSTPPESSASPAPGAPPESSASPAPSPAPKESQNGAEPIRPWWKIW